MDDAIMFLSILFIGYISLMLVSIPVRYISLKYFKKFRTETTRFIIIWLTGILFLVSIPAAPWIRSLIMIIGLGSMMGFEYEPGEYKALLDKLLNKFKKGK